MLNTIDQSLKVAKIFLNKNFEVRLYKKKNFFGLTLIM